MSTDVRSSFRISVWPGTLLPVPAMMAPISLTIVTLDRDDVLAIPLEEGNMRRGIVLPQELYLREVRGLDITSTSALVDFTLEYGLISRGLHQLPLFDEFSPHAVTSPKRTWALEDHSKTVGIRWTRSEAIVSQYGDDEERSFHDVSPFEYAREVMRDENTLFIPCEEIRMLVSLVRDMTNVWDMYTQHAPVEWLQGHWESQWLFTPTHDVRALWFLSQFLSAGLGDFHVRMDLEISDNDKPALRTPAPTATLYGALCLQLANHIALAEVYRRCVKCQRLFVRQLGRAKYGQHRCDSLYCSSGCARAHAQQELKKRQLEARRLHRDDGLNAREIADGMGWNEGSVARWISVGKRQGP